MRIAILHLSDFHFKHDDQLYTKKIEELVNSLGVVGAFERCIIVFSGDAANSGNNHEFRKAAQALKMIISSIRKKYDTPYIPLLCVPGNHDMCLTPDSRTQTDIEGYYKNNTVEAHLHQELASMTGFFSQRFYDNKIWKNQLVSNYFFNCEGATLQFNLINTAPFSTLKQDNKELHYFPKELLYKLHKDDNASYCISVMHHCPEWFNWSCKTDLENTIYSNSEFLFTGHDHVGSGKTISLNTESGQWVSAAGSMNFSDHSHEDSFSLVLIDTKAHSFSGYIFSWNPNDDIYYHEKQIDNARIINKSNQLRPLQSYINEIKDDSRHKITGNFLDYFVFPKLSSKRDYDQRNETCLTSFEEFDSYLSTRQVIYIDGESNSGKTTLLKYLYLRLSQKKIALFWDVHSTTGKITNIIKTLFTDQYGESSKSSERFLQSPKENKIFIVDDWDGLKAIQQESVLNYIKDTFGHIILSRNVLFGNGEIDIKEDVRDSLVPDDETEVLYIQPFFKSKRDELIQKICVAQGDFDDSRIETVTSAIYSLVQNHSTMFLLNPEFIIQYTLFFSREEEYCYHKGERLFGTIFEHNIKELIISNTSPYNVDEYITVLEEIAYYMFSNGLEKIAMGTLIDTIQQYNSQYCAQVHARKFVDTMLTVKVFRNVGSTYDISFSNRNYLAYFVARYIYRDLLNNDNFTDIKFCAKYICFGINADILMFITYITSNTRIIKTIGEISSKLMQDWECFQPERTGSRIITQLNDASANTIKAPSQKDVKDVETYREHREETSYENLDISTRGIFDYDMEEYDTPKYQIQRAFAYTEMLSKALPTFFSIIRREQKLELIEQIYCFPNKIIKAVLDPFETNIDAIIDDLMDMSKTLFEEGKLKHLPTKDDVMFILNTISISIVLGFFDHFAECATNKKTIDLLTERTPQSNMEHIQRLLFIENSGNTDKLFDESKELLSKSKQPYMQAMIKLIMREHLLEHIKTIPYDKRTSIIDTIFGKEKRKEFPLWAPSISA